MIKSDKMEEECGVFGYYSLNKRSDIAGLAYYGLCALQHRGQESAGISILNGKLKTIKGMGLVSEVFKEDDLNISGNAVIGHVRYSTTGDSCSKNAQPLQGETKFGQVAVAHNGNLVNNDILKEILEDSGMKFETTIDSEVILKLMSRGKKNMQDTLISTTSAIKGSFALVFLIEDKLVGVRDPHGIRPLCLGKTEDGFALASESCALDAVGADFVRDIEAGEIVIIDNNGVVSYKYSNATKAPCSFEHIYFARPDSIIDGIEVYMARYEAGKKLWEQNKIDADIVIGVPDSGIPAATGFAKASGIAYATGLVKNKYIGRTFIKPSQELREKAVQVKLNPIKKFIDGKRVVVVDDSLVRGTTSKKLIAMLRRAGAKEVHFRSASPMVSHSCYFGIDTAARSELLASKMNIEEMTKEIGADSLDFLSVHNLINTLGGNEFCIGCFNGMYPISTINE